MVKSVHDIAPKMLKRNDPEYDSAFERLGAARFSVYNDFGIETWQEELLKDYSDFYKDKTNENKNKIVTSYLARDFESIRPLMLKNEQLIGSNFLTTVKLAQAVQAIQKNVINPNRI